MSEDELRAQLEEELKRIRVEDVVVQTAVTLVNLAGRRLGLADAEDERDLDQARLAIDAVRALLPLLPAEPQRAVREAVSQLQIAFAREAKAPEQPQAERQDAPAKTEGEPRMDEAQRAKARSKIWTPPGSSS